VLAMAMALGPFGLDTYLPAFPSLATSLHTSIAQVSFSVSLYIFGLALGQLLGGPLSDHFGRTKIMVGGLVLFCLSSLMLAFSHTLTELLIWRAIQALGGGWVVVSVPAIVRDRTEGIQAARLFSLIGLMMIIAPALAPSIGSLMLTFANWRSIFWFLAIYSLIVVLYMRRYVFSASMPLRAAPRPKFNFFAGFTPVLRHNMALYLIFLQAFAYSIMMIFLTHASFIYQMWFGVSKFTFSLLFACNIATMALLNRGGRILLRWLQPLSILCMAVLLQIIAVGALVFIVVYYPRIELFIPALMVSIGALGAITPNNQACYLQFFPQNSASAAALMGTVQFSIAGGMSALSACVSNGALLPIILTMAVCAILCIALVCRIFLLNSRSSTNQLQ
jgi:MFS transporter, DHA1 family, multidrug resistance protein